LIDRRGALEAIGISAAGVPPVAMPGTSPLGLRAASVPGIDPVGVHIADPTDPANSAHPANSIDPASSTHPANSTHPAGVEAATTVKVSAASESAGRLRCAGCQCGGEKSGAHK
jgi:hypothetical protein